MLLVEGRTVDFSGAATKARTPSLHFDELNQMLYVSRPDDRFSLVDSRSFDVDERADFSFRLKGDEPIKAMALSSDLQMVALQRDDYSLDVALISQRTAPGGAAPDIVAIAKHVCSSKVAPLLGFRWVAERHLVLVGSDCVELHAVHPKKLTLKCLRTVPISVAWFLYHPPSQLMIIAAGSNCSTLNALVVQPSAATVQRLSTHGFEVDFGCSRWKSKLTERDLLVAMLYDRVCLLVLKCGSAEGVTESVNVYEFSPSDPYGGPLLACVLKLNIHGLIHVHTVESVVIVHHQESQSSLVFDVRQQGQTLSPQEGTPLLDDNGGRGQSAAWVLPELEPICTTRLEIDDQLACRVDAPQIYSTNSSLFPPNLVVNAKTGLMAGIVLRLESASKLIDDKAELLAFLLRRPSSTALRTKPRSAAKSEEIFLDELRQCIRREQISTRTACAIFNRILERAVLQKQQVQSPPRDTNQVRGQLVATHRQLELDHNAIMRSVFDPLREDEEINKELLAHLVLEFYLAVKKMNVPMEHHYLPELLLKVLVDGGQFGKLQQLLQYRALPDSKFLAMELISLSELHPSLRQLAIDMFARRGNNDQIVDALADEGRLVEAIRCMGDSVPSRTLCLKLLEKAWATNDRTVQYTVFSHLAYALRSPHLADESNEDTNKYTSEFKELFSSEEVEEAERRFRLARISEIRNYSVSENFDDADLSATENGGENGEETIDPAGNSDSSD